MNARVLHVSDFHLRRGGEPPAPLPALQDLVTELRPELVIATGDLSHRGRHVELVQAAEVLRSLGPPSLAVPGNHDIPMLPPGRFTRPLAAWRSVFGSPDAIYSSDRLCVVGLSSVRPWRQQGGALGGTSRERVANELGRAPEGALKVVALHHHLAAPPWRAPRKRPLARRDSALQAFARAGAHLVVAGHVHQVGIAERREFEVLDGDARHSLVLATAPGFGRPRPRRKGEAQGANVYEADGDTLTVLTYAWVGDRLERVARRSFSIV